MLTPFIVKAENFDPFEGKNTVTISTLGGSLTSGDGSYYSTRGWANKLHENYYPEKYSDKNFVLKNAGVGGTGSEYGLLRFATDVGVHNPDIVFIEYGVNDRRESFSDTQADEEKRNIESIIRQCMALPSNPYVALVGFTVYDFQTEVIRLQKEVADYYGIPMLDLSGYIKNECDKQTEADGYQKKFIAAFGGGDGVHPDDGGYMKWYEEIIRQMDELGSGFYKRPAAKPAMYDNTTDVRGLSNVTANKISSLPMPEGWEIGEDYTSRTGEIVKTYTTDVVGARLSFTFHGNSLAFLAHRGGGLGKFRVTVDKGTENEKIKEFTQFFKTSLGYAGRTSYVFGLGTLGNGWHTAEVENIQNDITDSELEVQSRTVLAYYCTNPEKLTPEVISASVDGVPKSVAGSQLTVPVGAKQIKLYFDGAFDNMNADTISFISGGERVDCTAEYNTDEKSFTFNLSEPLNVPNMKYTVVLSSELKLNGVPIGTDRYVSVLTNSGMYFDELSFTDKNGNELSSTNMESVKFSMTAHNNVKDGKEKVFAAAAQRGADGKLKAVCTDIGEAAAEASVSLEAQMELVSPSLDDTIEVMAWKYEDNKPYMEKLIYSLKTFTVSKAGDNVGVFFANPIALSDAVSELSAIKAGRRLTVSGNSSERLVSVLITDMSGNIVYLNQAAAENGAFSMDCMLSDIKDETYTINVN